MKNSTTYAGELPADIWHVLKAAWRKGIALQGDFARNHASSLALAASQGWVSVISPDHHSYEQRWRITMAGQTALNFKELFKCSPS